MGMGMGVGRRKIDECVSGMILFEIGFKGLNVMISGDVEHFRWVKGCVDIVDEKGGNDEGKEGENKGLERMGEEVR